MKSPQKGSGNASSLGVDFTESWLGEPLSLSALAPSPGRLCELCQKSFRSDATYRTHLESSKHRQREQEMDGKHSPVKKSPTDRKGMLAAQEKSARLLATGGPGAQAMYNVGLEYGRRGMAQEAERCLLVAVERLPPLTEAAAVGRIMIEVKARLILARIAWLTQEADARRHLLAALAVLSVNHVPPILDFDGWPSIEQMDANGKAWRQSLRHADLWEPFKTIGHEFGARLGAKQASLPAAALLWYAESFAFAAILFREMDFFGHVSEALFRAGKMEECVDVCIDHGNPVLLMRLSRSMVDPELTQLANAVVRWDLRTLEHLAFSTSVHRFRARRAMLLLAKSGYSQKS